VLFQRAFPHDGNAPAGIKQVLSCPTVSFDVSRELGRPELRSGCRLCRKPTAGVTVPEATMHENGRPEPRQYNVRPTRQIS
jgi:hypothetical protein